ncbi:MAG: HD domain-containing protein [Clostridia bacterium]
MTQQFNIPKGLERLARLFYEAGARLYAVGGMIRNPLLGLPVSDMDITSAMLPGDLIALCEHNGIHHIEKGIDFGTIELHYSGMSLEHTTFRSDIYGEGGTHRPQDVRFTKTLGEDAFRRDFTINAIYLDILDGGLSDPTGGLHDISARIMRATNPDPAVIMQNDALRILRMARFAAELGFDVEDETLNAAKRFSAKLKDISHERIRDELTKILLSDIRYANSSGVLRGLTLLEKTGALDVILPELALGRAIQQKAAYHAYDVLWHSLHTAQEAQPTIVMRLAGLLHDVGKPKVYIETGKMYNHDAIGENIAREILTRLKYPNAIKKQVCTLVRYHMYDLSGLAKENTLRMKFALLGYETSLALCDMREADVHGSGRISGEVKTAERWRDILARMKAQGAPFCEDELKCTGADIMQWLSLPSSPRIGEIKRAMLLHCAQKPQDNVPEKLKKLARDMM